jgi:hypothetical protein
VVAGALGVDLRDRTLEPIGPEPVACEFPDTIWRTHVLHALVVTACIDGSVSAEKLAALKPFAAALAPTDPWIRNLARIAGGRRITVFADTMRRMPIWRELWRDLGLRAPLTALRMAARRLPVEPDVSWKFKQFGLLPEGTLGREFWAYMTAHKLSFAGEPDGIIPQFQHHEFIHLLTSYPPDDEGEMLVWAFHAGWLYAHDHSGSGAFAYIFSMLMAYHLGFRTWGYNPRRFLFKPAKVLRAMERGAGLKCELNSSFDYMSMIELPIDEVRSRINLARP